MENVTIGWIVTDFYWILGIYEKERTDRVNVGKNTVWEKILYGLRKYYHMYFCFWQKNFSANNLSDKVRFLQNFLVFGRVTDIFLLSGRVLFNYVQKQLVFIQKAGEIYSAL